VIYPPRRNRHYSFQLHQQIVLKVTEMLRIAGFTSAIFASLMIAAVAHASVEGKNLERVAPRVAQNFTLTFKGDVDARRSKIRVFGVNGEVKVGAVYVGDRRQDLVVPLTSELRPGLYFVTFDAYSTKGNRATGTSEMVVPDIGDGTMQPVAQAIEP
jgi:methionine-rich copper-binding protein CopC